MNNRLLIHDFEAFVTTKHLSLTDSFYWALGKNVFTILLSDQVRLTRPSDAWPRPFKS